MRVEERRDKLGEEMAWILWKVRRQNQRRRV